MGLARRVASSDRPLLGRYVAPNLTRLVRQRSDAELARAIRHGVRVGGTSTVAMPSAMFYHLSDGDLGAIPAYLRSLPPAPGPRREVRLGPLARVGLLLGNYSPQAALIDHDAPRFAADPSDTVRYGRYLAMTSCSECHGPTLGGGMGPDLVVATTYPETSFARLLRTGQPLGERALKVISPVARSRFSSFTDAEVHALHVFLEARAEGALRPPPPNETR